MSVTPAIRPISYNSIDNRKNIVIDGEEMVEMTTQVFDPSTPITFANNVSFITQNLEGRPNLVARILMGSDDYADIMMHYNDISNPYSISSDMIIVLPNLNDGTKAIQSGVSKSDKIKSSNNLSKKELNKKINTRDKKRVMELLRQNDPSVVASLRSQAIGSVITNDDGTVSYDISNIDNITLDDAISKLDFIRTPNMAESDQFKAINGKIIFGSNISNIRCSGGVSPTQGKTEIIRQTVQNLIVSGDI